MRFESAGRAGGARGFTLVELMVVVVITAVLATIGMPLAGMAQRRAKEEELRSSLRVIRSALDKYKRLVDEGRIEQTAGGSGYPPRLDMLVKGIKDARSPSGASIYLLRSLPRDPFAGDAGDVLAEQTWIPRSYASGPDDPKPGDDVFDVHSTSQEVGLNGVPYAQW